MRLGIIALATAVSLTACSSNSASGAQDKRGMRSFALDGFERVELAGADDVRVTTGAGFSVRAEGPQAVLDALKIEVVDGTLRVARERGDWNWGENSGSATVTVTMPRATGARITGAGDLTLDRGTDDFEGVVSGSGDLAVGRIEGGEVRLAISGSGDIGAAGNADQLAADVSGAGTIRAGELVARGAEVTVSGAGSVRARVDGNARVRLSGVGSADLGPNAVCEVRKSGVGSVRCGG